MLNQYQPAEDGPGSGFHSRLFSGLIVINAVNIIGVLRDLVPMYSRNGFLRSPLGAAKTSLNRQVVCEMRIAKTSPCKVNSFFSSKLKRKTFSKQSQRTCSCIHRYLTSLLIRVYTKGGSKLAQAYNKVLYRVIHAWNFGHKKQAVSDHRDCKKNF